MSKSLPVFQQLGVLDDCLKKTQHLEKRLQDFVTRERNMKAGYGNVPQWPTNSFSAVKALSTEYQGLVSDSHRLYHSVNTSAMKNRDMMQNAEKILQWMEIGVEQCMKSHGITARGELASENENSQPIGHMMPGDACYAEPTHAIKSIEESAVNKDLPQHQSKREECRKSIHTSSKGVEDDTSLPKSPVLPSILKHYRSKSDSFCSPQDPLKVQFMESDEHNEKTKTRQLCDTMNLESPQLRSFYRPILLSEVKSPSFVGHYFNKNLLGKGDISKKGQSKSFFGPIQSPQLNVEILNSPELTLHSRRSILAQPPATVAGDDDDTVYCLFSHGRHLAKNQQNLESPPQPNLAYHKNIPPTECARDSHFVLPSPEMPLDVLSDRNAYSPSKFQDYEICQSKYDTLPSYVKRIMTLAKCNECLKNVMNASVSWQGNPHKKVISEATVAEVTFLDKKTKSFIFILTNLQIIKDIKGTSYYEILV